MNGRKTMRHNAYPDGWRDIQKNSSQAWQGIPASWVQPVFPHLLLVFIYLASISCSQMPAYSSFPEKILILTAIIIALSMCEFWVLLYLFPILTATVRNSITLILHINWDIGRLRYLFHGQWKWNISRSVMSNSVISWTVACQAPPSVEFSRQEYWSGMPLPSPNP